MKNNIGIDLSEIVQELDNMWEEKDKEPIGLRTALKVLSMPDLLGFVDAAFEEKDVNNAVKGEIHSKLTSFMLCNSMSLGIHLMIVFKASSSSGKTNLANMVTGFFKTKKIGELSATALKYSEEEDYDILYYQETSEKESGRKSFKFISSDDGGFTAETTIKNPDTGEFVIQKTEVSAKGFVTTTTAIGLDNEFATRSYTIPLDESQEQTERILRYNLGETERKMALLDGSVNFGKKYDALKDALDQLSLYEVAIPFESEIRGIFPTKNVPLRVRRDSKKLVTLIKSSALLFQHQRPKVIVKDKLLLVATWQDLYNAIRIALPILNATMTGYDSRTRKVIKLLPEIILEHGAITSENLAITMGRSSNYAGRILKQLSKSGYIYEDKELKIEMGIKDKTKVYGLNEKNRVETCNSAMQDINWANVFEKQRMFLDRYRAKCGKNEKHKTIVETYLIEYNRYARIVYDPIDQCYMKLEQDDKQIMHFALLTSKEEEALNNSISKDGSCKTVRQDIVIESPIAVNEIPDDLDWLKGPMYETIFDAKNLIIETLENPAHLNSKGCTPKDKIIDILDASFDFGTYQSKALIKFMLEDGDIIEPEEGYLASDMPVVKYGEDFSIIELLHNEEKYFKKD